MTPSWPNAAGAPDAVVLMEGMTFCISDSLGDFTPARPAGLFVRDTRMLSRWSLDVESVRPEPLAVHHGSPHAALLVSRVSVPNTGNAEGATELLLVRERFVGEGMLEVVRVTNTTGVPAVVQLTLEAAADFSDVFAVREGSPTPAQVETTAGDGSLRLTGRGPDGHAVTVSTDREAKIDGSTMSWSVELEGHGSWTTNLQVVPTLHGVALEPHHVPEAPPEQAVPARRHRQFRKSTPRVSTAWRPLADVLSRSLVDFATLRIFDPDRPRLPVIAAGAPWSMALFGRDSLLSSMMLLPVDAYLAFGTLTTLAAHQGTGTDPRTGEEPGRIPHELRFGPSTLGASTGEGTHYRSADATPLFVMAAGELHRWHPELVSHELVECTDRALAWMLGPGDPDGDGLLECPPDTHPSRTNHGWKDSPGAITRADGSLPEPPLALAEVQAYAYAAYVARAEMAEAARQEAVAKRWRREAERIKRAFNDAFWLPEHGWYAVALDRDKRPVDALTSNPGHCLWAGIVDDDKAESLVERLMSPSMFTGWGIRTLSSDMAAYNPLGYHTGSVWPHDTALCVAGMARYGFTSDAATLAQGLLEAAAESDHRLPELFAGVSRSEVPFPVPHPAACSPQAWAAAAPVEILRALLGLEPCAEGGLRCDPCLPTALLPLELRGVHCRGTTYDVTVHTDGVEVRARS